MELTLGHATDEKLERYVLGRLPESEAERLEEHLLLCYECQDRLQETDDYVRAVREASRELLRKPPSVLQEWKARLRMPAPIWQLAYGAPLAAAVLAVLIVPFQSTPPTSTHEVQLHSARGIEAPGTSRAPVGKRLVLNMDLTGLPLLSSYRVQVVDAAGKVVQESTAPPSDGSLSLSVERKLGRGQYWIRVYDASPQRTLLREFGLKAE